MRRDMHNSRLDSLGHGETVTSYTRKVASLHPGRWRSKNPTTIKHAARILSPPSSHSFPPLTCRPDQYPIMPPPPPTSSWPPASSATPPPPPPDDEELPPYSPCRGGPSCRDHNSTEPAVRRPGAPRQPSYSAWAPSVVHSRAGLSRLRAMERVESDEERRERVRREQEAELAHWREQVALATILREAEEDSRPQRRAHATSRGLGPTSSAAPAPTPSPPSSSSALGLHGVSHTPVAPSSPPLPTSRTRPRAGTSPAPHSRSPSTTTSPTSTQPQPHLSHTSSSSSLSSYRSNTSSAPHTPPDNTSALPLPLPAWCNSPAPTPRLTRSASAPNFELLTLEDLEAAYTPVRGE